MGAWFDVDSMSIAAIVAVVSALSSSLPLHLRRAYTYPIGVCNVSNDRIIMNGLLQTRIRPMVSLEADIQLKVGDMFPCSAYLIPSRIALPTVILVYRRTNLRGWADISDSDDQH
ncbi:hypothetical protein B0H12DRAFT_1100613 [Mycena haematopus]|nr:hypothetical protein B0H12DRAFT_1100613 [Mycena haematopus]